MTSKRAALIILLSAAIVLTAVPLASARDGGGGGGGEYKAIVTQLKTRYRAKKVKIPFLWLARFAVSVARPAGVKSFSVTMFQDLKFSRETLDTEMQAAMRQSFGPEWNQLIHVRSRDGQQAYVYIRESGTSVRLAAVTIDKQQAAVIRATFNPDKLINFINDPSILGIHINDNDAQDTGGKPAEPAGGQLPGLQIR